MDAGDARRWQMKMLMAALAMAVTMTAAPSVTGTWTMSVTGGPHGDATMGLTLKQEGTTVSGTFASGHGPDMAVKGEFVDGSLKLETEGGDHGKITLTAKLKDDGTLSGYISSPVGDMKWVARKDTKDSKDSKDWKDTEERP
jgi:hypothetical protein